MCISRFASYSLSHSSNCLSIANAIMLHTLLDKIHRATCSGDSASSTSPPRDYPYRMYVCSPKWSAKTAFHAPSLCRHTWSSLRKIFQTASGRSRLISRQCQVIYLAYCQCPAAKKYGIIDSIACSCRAQSPSRSALVKSSMMLTGNT